PSGQLQGGGQKIPEGPDLLADGASPDFPRPAHDHRHADAAFIEVALAAAQGAAAAKKVRLVPAFLVWAIVAAEEDDRVTVQAKFLENSQEFADVGVQARNHGRVIL